MDSFLGPTPPVKAILDKLDPLYDSVSTFDVMIQGCYRESQGRSESLFHHVTKIREKTE